MVSKRLEENEMGGFWGREKRERRVLGVLPTVAIYGMRGRSRDPTASGGAGAVGNVEGFWTGEGKRTGEEEGGEREESGTDLE